MWEQRRGSFLLESGSTGPWELKGRTWSFSWPCHLFLKPPIGVEDDAWGIKKMPGKEDGKDFLSNGPSQYDPSMGTWPGAQKIPRGPNLAGRASAKQVNKESQPTRHRPASVPRLRRTRWCLSSGLVPVPETSCYPASSLGDPGLGPAADTRPETSTGRERPPSAGGAARAAAQPPRRSAARPQPGLPSARGPSRSYRENEKEMGSGLATKEDPRDLHPTSQKLLRPNGLWGRGCTVGSTPIFQSAN
nr:uncharacterized protein LOC105714099 [Aotus nancymaae]